MSEDAHFSKPAAVRKRLRVKIRKKKKKKEPPADDPEHPSPLLLLCSAPGRCGRGETLQKKPGDARGFKKTFFFPPLTSSCDRCSPSSGRQHDVLSEAAAVHGERTELIYLRSGPAAPVSGVPR